jgi:hypothetical protein
LANDDYSECVVKNTRLYLRAILNEALQCRIIDVNPAARLIKPRNTRKAVVGSCARQSPALFKYRLRYPRQLQLVC